MRPLVLCSLIALLPLTSIAATVKLTADQIEPAPVFVTRIDCRIVIDKDGHIARYVGKASLPGTLAQDIERMVRQLRFEPVEVDGKVVNAETDMRVAIVAHKLEDGGLRLNIDNVTFPLAEEEERQASKSAVRSRPAIRYPAAGLRVGGEADVVVAVYFDANGDVRDAAAQQSALVNARGRARDVASVLDVFEKASVQMLRQWKVDPAQMPDDSRVPGGYVSYINVQYRLAEGARQLPPEPKPGQWQLETRTLKRVPAWVPAAPGVSPPGVADLADGEMGFSNPRFRLAQPLTPAGS